MSDKFNQAKYIQEYNKQHYRTFKVDLKKEEFEELEELLKYFNMTKANFLRDSIEQLKMRKMYKDTDEKLNELLKKHPEASRVLDRF